MPTPRTALFAVAAVALAATAVASWHRNAAEVGDPGVQTETFHKPRADIVPDAVYLPGLFLDEERAAPIEPLPPQF